MANISVLNLDGTNRDIRDASAIHSISVNGVAQTVSSNAVNLDIETNLITDTTWTSLSSLWSTS